MCLPEYPNIGNSHAGAMTDVETAVEAFPVPKPCQPGCRGESRVLPAQFPEGASSTAASPSSSQALYNV